MNYTHLTPDKRYQIDVLLEAGHRQTKIAKLMKCQKKESKGKKPQPKPVPTGKKLVVNG